MHPPRLVPFILLSSTLVPGVGCLVDDTQAETEHEADLLDRSASSLASGLILHWTFEDHDGATVLDMSGNGHHGTMVGGIDYAASDWGQSAVFDGVNDHIAVEGLADPADYPSGAFTVSARVMASDVDKYNHICAGCGPIEFMSYGTPSSGPRVMSKIWNTPPDGWTYPSSQADLINGKWANITMIVEEGVGTRYFYDCAENGNIPNAGLTFQPYNYTGVGTDGSGGAWFGGEMDDLRIWDRALTAAEVLGLCTEMTPGAQDLDAPCNDAAVARDYGVTLPDPPRHLPRGAVPAGAIPVATTEELIAAVAVAGNENIVLAGGDYDPSLLLVNGYLELRGQHLWATPGSSVTLHFGVDMGNNPPTPTGGGIHGISFDIDDEANAVVLNPSLPYKASAIVIWGAETSDVIIEDVSIEGNGALHRGIRSTASEGLVLRRVAVNDVLRMGIGVSGKVSPTGIPQLSDLQISNVRDPEVCEIYADHPGATEIGLWLGTTAQVSKVRIRDIRWTAIGTAGESFGSTFENIDIDRIGDGLTSDPECGGAGVGVYFDNLTKDTSVHKFCIGRDVRRGINSEWDENGESGDLQLARGIRHTVSAGNIEAWEAGIFFDQGTVDPTVFRVRFDNYGWGAIGFHRNVATELSYTPTLPVVPDDYDANEGWIQFANVFERDEVPGEVCGVTNSHLNYPPVCE